MKDTLGENPYIGFRRNHFSDCIVYSANRTPEGLYEMFQATGVLTSNLLQYDVMVHGRLTAGGAHHSREFIYGTAVNRAVVIEYDKADGPMTIVSDEVVEDAKRYGLRHQQWIVQDPSGKHFVHFLISYAYYRLEPIYAGKIILERPGGRIVDFVNQRLNRDTGRVLEKARWLKGYWNQTVAINGVFKTIEAGVAERYESGGLRSHCAACICPILPRNSLKSSYGQMSIRRSKPKKPSPREQPIPLGAEAHTRTAQLI